jgi:hypothetical protein
MCGSNASGIAPLVAAPPRLPSRHPFFDAVRWK